MKLKLHASVSSPQDLKALILEIKQYSQWFLHADIKKRVAGGESSEPPVFTEAATGLIHEWAGDKPLTQESLDKLIATLEDFADVAPSMAITLAAPPSPGLKKTLVTWCRENVDQGILVSFDFNSTLLGGMVVRQGSRVFDWSFRRQILAARGGFPEVLRRV